MATINGTAKKETLRGTAGADRINGLDGDDLLLGLAGNDKLFGGNGRDTLDGGKGKDTLAGGASNDTYLIDNTGDKVIEKAGQGFDVIKSRVSHTLEANVEKLVLTGTQNINGKGNGIANTIVGNAGNNTIDGGAGADNMSGGAGNDTYIVDNAGDKVADSSGVDTVVSSITHTLAAGIENLTLSGTGDLDGTGNALGNVVTGTSGSNHLYGLDGDDVLIGGAGRDFLFGGTGVNTFVYRTVADSAYAGNNPLTWDVINNFQAGIDKIDLSAFHGQFMNASIFENGSIQDVSIDVGADGSFDIGIRVVNSGSLTWPVDFIL